MYSNCKVCGYSLLSTGKCSNVNCVKESKHESEVKIYEELIRGSSRAEVVNSDKPVRMILDAQYDCVILPIDRNTGRVKVSQLNLAYLDEHVLTSIIRYTQGRTKFLAVETVIVPTIQIDEWNSLINPIDNSKILVVKIEETYTPKLRLRRDKAILVTGIELESVVANLGVGCISELLEADVFNEGLSNDQISRLNDSILQLIKSMNCTDRCIIRHEAQSTIEIGAEVAAALHMKGYIPDATTYEDEDYSLRRAKSNYPIQACGNSAVQAQEADRMVRKFVMRDRVIESDGGR